MYYNKNTIVYLNGKFIKATDASTNLYSQTLHYGSGVFEGIRSYNTEDGVRIFKAKEHYDRLLYSAKKMHIKLDLSSKELEKITYQVLQKNNLKDAYIRPLVYLGENMSLNECNRVNVVIMAWEWGNYLGNKLLRVQLSGYQRPNPLSCHVEAKVVGHYTNSILATKDAKSKGYDEALLCDSEGFIAEGPGANFFVEKEEVLFTPPRGNILPGITRQTVFELAEELGIKVVEKKLKKEHLRQVDTAFFCGTAAEIVGIKSIDHLIFKLKWEDSISSMIQKKYKMRVSKNEFQNVFV
ncbi:MAG: branched-chain amino acid transaminase [Crocinitomicaceae bacterium]|nr:branched-chain amino acid transaminase [Crocinitomicaceae bacterium]